jgi:DHA2 family multidrug resistance protein-like MFS transporter
LGVLLAGYLVFALGLALSFAVAVDLVVASAPPERAGSASALAETGAELGGATGIALLGSVITFLYRGKMADAAPHAAAEAAQSIGSAVAVAQELGGEPGNQLLDTARAAFAQATSVTSVICAVALLACSITAAVMLPKHLAE